MLALVVALAPVLTAGLDFATARWGTPRLAGVSGRGTAIGTVSEKRGRVLGIRWDTRVDLANRK